MSGRGPCADCDPSSASTASVSSDLHKYHVACSCGNGPPGAGQYAECAPTGPNDTTAQKVERPPALPPRPPPRPRPNGNARPGENTTTNQNNSTGPRKYVWWCMGMGTASCLLGGFLLAASFLLRALTISLHHLETIPTPIPATMLVLTGLCVMSLARRRNRYNYLIKIAGACCLVCALTCVLVTITTTVIHMNRLQTLRQCFYTDETKTCICSSALMDSGNGLEDEGVKCVFEEVSDCGAIHGSLYRCLSAIFGLSVAGVLVCICSAMLAYQLLSHEKKKMYWEQLELRCRSLYRPATGGQQPRPHNQQPQVCGECCTQCRAAAAANWDLQQRFWASGRVGNLYSPNPGSGRRVSPWSWFPWTRNSNQRVGGSSSGDSAYGFGNSPAGYWQLGPPPPYTPHHRYLHHQHSGSGSSHHHMHHSHSPVHMPHTCPMMNQSNRSGYPNSLTPHGSVSDLESQHLSSTSHHHHHQGSLRMGLGMCHQTNQMPVRVLPCHDPGLLSLSPGHFVPINDSERQSDDSIVHRAECHHQGNPNPDEFPEALEDVHHSQHTCQKHSQITDPEMRQPPDAQGEENLAFQCEKQTSARQARGGESELYFADVSSCCNVSLKTVEYCAGLVGTIEAQADTSSGDSDVGSCPAFKGRPPRPRPNHSGIPNLQSKNSPSPCLNNPRWKKQNTPSPVCSSPNRTKKKSPIVSKESPNPNSSRTSAHYQDGSLCYNCTDGSCKMSNRCVSDAQIASTRKLSHDIPEEKISNINMSLNHMEGQDNSFIDVSNRSSMRIRASPNRSSINHSMISQGSDLNDVGLPPISQARKDDSLIMINNDLNSSKNMEEFNEASNRPMRRLISMDDSNEEAGCSRMDDSITSSPSRRKAQEEMLSKEDNIKNSRRKVLDDTMMSSDSNSSSPFRRMCIEDSPISDSDLTVPMRSHLEDSFLNNTPLRRKNINNSMRICDDSFQSKDNNISSRRKSIEDSLNCSNAMKRKGIDESMLMNPMRRKMFEEFELMNDGNLRRKCVDEALLLLNDPNESTGSPLRRFDENLFNHGDVNVAKLNFVHMMQHNARYSDNFVNDDLNEPSLVTETEGSRRGIVGGVCIAPDLRYEPVQGFENNMQMCDNGANQVAPMHMRCYSDSNTMDSGWHSGSEKHVTD